MKELGNKITEFSNLYFIEYSKATKARKLVFKDEQMAFIFYMLDKLIENFSAVGELLKLSEKEGFAYLRNSVYILIRACLSDVILLNWLLSETNSGIKNDEVTKSKVSELRQDHIKYYISHLKKLDGLGLLTKKDKVFELNIINTIYKDLLQKPITSELNFRDSITNSTSIRDMLNEKNKYNKVLVGAYKEYYVFSKIEHTGEFTRMMLEKTYNPSDENPLDSHVKHSIHVIERTIKAAAPIFIAEQSFVNEFKTFEII